MELVLPSGTRLGHRSLHRYYKQHLRPHHGEQQHRRRRHHHDSALIQRLASRYRELGVYPAAALHQQQQAVTKKQHADHRQQHTRQAALALRVGRKNNTQQHYRAQVDF